MRETAITLLACAMVLLPAPAALAAQHTAAVLAAPGNGQSAVEPRAEQQSPTPTPSPTGDADRPDDRPSFPSWPSMPPWPPDGSEPTPIPTPTSTPPPTPTPTSGEPSGEPSGSPSEEESDHQDVQAGLRQPETSAGPDAGRTPPGWTEQVSDRGTGTVEDDHGDDGDGASDGTGTENRAATPVTGQLLPVLPLGAGLTFLGLGLASFALRLRR
ncbi:hypothetical protein [Streptomyces macrosporus]|uniref:Gram-positive cocci surface proteins LPxTG domain-containing protein n=1 Tax=Streptomyces macrosporus TaxID=44032 RepID=A0ABP5XWH0_9ACTN